MAALDAVPGALLSAGVQPTRDGKTYVWMSLATFGAKAPSQEDIQRYLRFPLEHALGETIGTG
jgi:hypothetical protein